jgi:hypothetical protein
VRCRRCRVEEIADGCITWAYGLAGRIGDLATGEPGSPLRDRRRGPPPAEPTWPPTHRPSSSTAHRVLSSPTGEHRRDAPARRTRALAAGWDEWCAAVHARPARSPRTRSSLETTQDRGARVRVTAVPPPRQASTRAAAPLCPPSCGQFVSIASALHQRLPVPARSAMIQHRRWQMHQQIRHPCGWKRHGPGILLYPRGLPYSLYEE